MNERPLISVVVPSWNEERSLPALHGALKSAFSGADFDGEFVFVDDGSTDASLEVLAALAVTDARVKVLSLSRNFGKEIAATAGIRHASGDAVVLMDADGQHPASLIPEFVRLWRAGAEVVVGVRRRQSDQTWSRRLGSDFFYACMSRISETPVTPRATDFRLLDRVVTDEFNRFTEHHRLTRALIDWLGFRRAYLEFDAPAREAGESRFGMLRLLRLALNSFVSHSLFPLKLAGYVGVIIVALSGPFGLFMFVNKYFLGDPFYFDFSGPAMLAVLNSFLVGIVLCSLGLIALYIANIHGEVVNRPLYAVRKRLNLPPRG
jgi:polyisoprenyl-phosphate glycosyltransferase